MKLGLVIYSTDAETVWNALRLGIFARQQGDQVRAFLLANGVECTQHNTPPFAVTDQLQAFADAGGRILACGTCLQIRQQTGSELCPLSTLRDLYELVRECDKVLTC